MINSQKSSFVKKESKNYSQSEANKSNQGSSNTKTTFISTRSKLSQSVSENNQTISSPKHFSQTGTISTEYKSKDTSKTITDSVKKDLPTETLNSQEMVNRERFWELLKPKLRQVIKNMQNPFLKPFVKPKKSDLPPRAFLKKKFKKKNYNLKKLKKFRKCVLAVQFLRRFGRSLKVNLYSLILYYFKIKLFFYH